MSVPPGTEMFQFPGFASHTYVFSVRYPCGWVAPFGYPRINACSRLPVAFRSVPRPSSPPGAKASTECPSYTRYPRYNAEASHPPCTETILRSCLGAASPIIRTTVVVPITLATPLNHPLGQPWKYLLRTQQDCLECLATHRSRGQRTNHPTQSFTTPLNPRRPTIGALVLADSFPGQTHDRTTGPGSIRRQTASHTRPETHQNLIHPDKEQRTLKQRTNDGP